MCDYENDINNDTGEYSTHKECEYIRSFWFVCAHAQQRAKSQDDCNDEEHEARVMKKGADYGSDEEEGIQAADGVEHDTGQQTHREEEGPVS